MNERKITLIPTGAEFAVQSGTSLHSVLFKRGVEFPCGGRGTCHGCRIKIVKGSAEITDDDAAAFTPQEINGGWRLACRTDVNADLSIEIPQWELHALGDESRISFIPREGYGIAVDFGSTTIVAQLIDLNTGNVCGVQSELNDQAAYGADVISRIEYILNDNKNSLTDLSRRQLKQICNSLVRNSGITYDAIIDVVMCGNTVMHHIFHGLDITPLSRTPFTPHVENLQTRQLRPSELGWNDIPESTPITFLPGLGGLIGSDIFTGLVAMEMHNEEELTCLIDLGTNGEIVIGNKERLLCTSTAAGPAFEGARISMGMRATTGAIFKVTEKDKNISCSVLGNTAARGICGSGLVDAVAAGLSLEIIQPNGRLDALHSPWQLTPTVNISQKDIRELQLAKSAIATGIKILLTYLNADSGDIKSVYLSGGFGNSVDPLSARDIGLFPFDPGRVINVGNSALHGVKLQLFNKDNHLFQKIRQRTEIISLNEYPGFSDILAEEMKFPEYIKR